MDAPTAAQSQVVVDDFASLIPRKEAARSPKVESDAGHFFLGSGEATVLKLMGTPTGRDVYGSTTVLSYGLSRVSIKGGVVAEYTNSDDNLVVRAPKERTRGNSFVSTGSSSSDVYAVMGTPTSVDIYGSTVVLGYGLSRISFVDDKMTEYTNSDSNLRIK